MELNNWGEKLEKNDSKKSKFNRETDRLRTRKLKNKRQKKGLTAGTELMFICCGWFMGEGARAPMGA